MALENSDLAFRSAECLPIYVFCRRCASKRCLSQLQRLQESKDFQSEHPGEGHVNFNNFDMLHTPTIFLIANYPAVNRCDKYGEL